MHRLISVVPHNDRSVSPQRMDAGPSHYQQTPRLTRGSLHRTDGAHRPPPIYAQPNGRGRSNTSKSRSISPRKAGNRRQSHSIDPDEEEEAIENPNGIFRTQVQVQDQEDDDFECLDQPAKPTVANPNSFTMVAERTRGGRRSMEAKSPTRPVAEYSDIKGKGKAAGKEVFATRPPTVNTHATRLPTGSASPTKPSPAVATIDTKGKGKYVEVDDHHGGEAGDVNEEEISHLLTIDATKKIKAIPSSRLATDNLRCDTKVVRCIDADRESRRMWVWQVELHPDGISIGDYKNWKDRHVYIQFSNITRSQVCSAQAKILRVDVSRVVLMLNVRLS